MYAADHIRRVLLTFPGGFSGIGEFSIHKEFVSSKVAGHTASLRNPALDRILDTVAEIGLVAILHCDVARVRPGERPAHYDDLLAVLAAHPGASVVWAHTGLGRFVTPTDRHPALLDEMLADSRYDHVMLDISWDEVATYVGARRRYSGRLGCADREASDAVPVRHGFGARRRTGTPISGRTWSTSRFGNSSAPTRERRWSGVTTSAYSTQPFPACGLGNSVSPRSGHCGISSVDGDGQPTIRPSDKDWHG